MTSASVRSLDGLAGSPRSGSTTQPSRRDMLAWAVASSALLGGAGAWRFLHSNPDSSRALLAQPPFPLKTIPLDFNGWNTVGGSDKPLDPITTRITGATDHITRVYSEEATGTILSVLVLYGPAEPVLPHTPQVCYPANGSRSVKAPVDLTLRFNDHLSAVFRTDFFVKPGGRSLIQQLVYHSYRLDGVWSPEFPSLSLPRRHAGLFKVQIERLVQVGEQTTSDEPIESFLGQLIPTLERMIAAAASTSATPTSP